MSADLTAIAEAFEQGAGHRPCPETLLSLARRFTAFDETTAIIKAFLAGLLDRPELDAEARAAVEGGR